MALQPIKNWVKAPPYLDEIEWRHGKIHALLNNVLGRIFQYRDIVKEDILPWIDIEHRGDSLYLRRFYFIREGKWKRFLHFINRSDNDRHMHDHPWDFESRILWNGYQEVLPMVTGTARLEYLDYVEIKDRKPGQYLRNPAEHLHKVQLYKDKKGNEKPAWTFVHTGNARRVWGFMTEQGWMDWRTYLNLTGAADYAEDVVEVDV